MASKSWLRTRTTRTSQLHSCVAALVCLLLSAGLLIGVLLGFGRPATGCADPAVLLSNLCCCCRPATCHHQSYHCCTCSQTQTLTAVWSCLPVKEKAQVPLLLSYLGSEPGSDHSACALYACRERTDGLSVASNATDIGMLLPHALGAMASVAAQSMTNATLKHASGSASGVGSGTRRRLLAHLAFRPFSSVMRRQAALRERARDSAPGIAASDRYSLAPEAERTGVLSFSGVDDASSDEAADSTVAAAPQDVALLAAPPLRAASDAHSSSVGVTKAHCALPDGCEAHSSRLSPACARTGAAGSPGVVLSFAKDGNRLSLGREQHSTGLPYPVDGIPANVSFVAAGGHDVVIDSEHVMWSWGRNNSAGGGGYGSAPVPDSGQLGSTRQSGARVHAAAPLQTAERFVAADCGRYHTAAMSTAGKLHTWGAERLRSARQASC